MTKEKLIRFVCDTCGKEQLSKEEIGFPYVNGWMYLYKFAGKVGIENAPKTIEAFNSYDEQDKHFCSKKCLYNFVGQLVVEKQKVDIGNNKQSKTEFDM